MRTHIYKYIRKRSLSSYFQLTRPIDDLLSKITPLKSKSNRPLNFTLEHQLHSLVWFHLHEYQSGRELLQVMKKDKFARRHIAPPEGVSQSSFFEAMNTRGVVQLLEIFNLLFCLAKKQLPKGHQHLGAWLQSMDPSLTQ